MFADLPASLAGIQRYRQAWLELFTGLAAGLDMHIAAGSFLLEHVPGRYRNRCDWFTPDGRALWQDKLQLTGFEKKTGVIDAGDALKVFDIDGLRVGVAICYDSEFPLPVRAQYEAGACAGKPPVRGPVGYRWVGGVEPDAGGEYRPGGGVCADGCGLSR